MTNEETNQPLFMSFWPKNLPTYPTPRINIRSWVFGSSGLLLAADTLKIWRNWTVYALGRVGVARRETNIVGISGDIIDRRQASMVIAESAPLSKTPRFNVDNPIILYTRAHSRARVHKPKLPFSHTHPSLNLALYRASCVLIRVRCPLGWSNQFIT